MQSKAATVQEYLDSLPPDRREVVEAVRRAILENLDEGYEEGMQYGGIGYYVPHRVFPAGYHCDPKQPLPFAGLASQKGHVSLYLCGVYMDEGLRRWFVGAWEKARKKLDMGKGCVRFKRLDDVPLEVVGEVIRRVPVKKCVQTYERAMGEMRNQPARGAKKTTKTARKAPGKKKVGKPSARRG